MKEKQSPRFACNSESEIGCDFTHSELISLFDVLHELASTKIKKPMRIEVFIKVTANVKAWRWAGIL